VARRGASSKDLVNIEMPDWEVNMTAKEILLREAEQLPEPLAQEVLDFLVFLRGRSSHETGGTTDDALAYRITHPWKVADFKPLSRAIVHER
jgi:hypothetical protein